VLVDYVKKLLVEIAGEFHPGVTQAAFETRVACSTLSLSKLFSPFETNCCDVLDKEIRFVVMENKITLSLILINIYSNT
jgi:hypothetical protein